jgi:AcrR family transcriptional regulator
MSVFIMPSSGPRIPRKPAGRYHHGDLRRALIDASLELVRQRGPSGFTLAEICRAAGVSQAAPYRHFEGKDHVLAVAASEGYQLLHAAMAGIAREPNQLNETLERMARAYLNFAIRHPAHLAVMFSHYPGDHFGGLLKEPNHGGPDGLKNLPPPQNQTEEAILASWQAGQAGFQALTQAILTAAQGSPMAARINETTASHYSAAIWSMVHGLAMLLLERMIPPEWMQDDFKLAIELVVRPWINGLADMPTPVLSQMVNCPRLHMMGVQLPALADPAHPAG